MAPDYGPALLLSITVHYVAAAALVLLEHIELLRRFYGQVLVPEPVANELSTAGAPAAVLERITQTDAA